MTKSQARQRLESLKKEINHHRYLYHVLDRQEISASALDALKHELFLLEAKFPSLITLDSPSQRVGGEPLEKFAKAPHRPLMLSLSDAFTGDEMIDWLKRLKKLSKEPLACSYFSELKLDGLAVSLVYKKGIFTRGATRGSGEIGEDVTKNLKTIESIPLRLSKSIDCEARGEVYLSKQVFKKINQRRAAQGLPLYANPRNTAAGSVRQLDPRVTSSRQLSFIAWDILGVSAKTHSAKHSLLQALGFVAAEGRVCQGLKEIRLFYDEIERRRAKFPYEIDGIVAQVNEVSVYRSLGAVGKSPRGAMAWKFAGEEAVTMVKDIVIQVGRTGALTPVAVLKPVALKGALIARASLHNQDEIERLDVRIGDTVIVRRAGDVIPEVIRVLKKMRPGSLKKFQMPEQCPISGDRVKKIEAIHYCPNPLCPAQVKENLVHFVSRPAFAIEGLGEKIIEQLLNQGLVRSPADLFFLKVGDLLPLERFAAKSAKNLIQSIDLARKISLARFLVAVGMRHVGEETARLLAKKFPRLKALSRASQADLEAIPGIGIETAKSISLWFGTQKNRLLIKRLKQAGVKILKATTRKGKLSGKTFVFSGELGALPRNEAKQKVLALGGQVSSDVSKNTSALILGKNPGSKYQQALELGIKLLKEQEFLEMLASQ